MARTLCIRRFVSGHVPGDGDLATAATLEEEVGTDVCPWIGSVVCLISQIDWVRR